MSILKDSVENSTPVLISCRNNHKFLGKIRAFDRHSNLVLENVKELWTETSKVSKGKGNNKKGKPVSKERFISKLFLRGDSVIVILKA